MFVFMITEPYQTNTSILKALAYFDIFSYPLTFRELFDYSNHTEIRMFSLDLEKLIQDQLVYKQGPFYTLREDRKLYFRRITGNKLAKSYLSKAYANSKLISRFPFVRGVFISGSLSKGSMDEGGDIDFFIVTAPGRLWIARTFLILYKKLVLFNSHKYFCINYLITEDALKLNFENLFTATELITMQPVVNRPLYEKLLKENQWVKNFYSKIPKSRMRSYDLHSYRLKSLVEFLLKSPLIDKIDDLFMRITLSRWQRKFGKMSRKDFEIALKTTKQVSKHHPGNFQKLVLKEFEKRMFDIQQKLDEVYRISQPLS